VSAATTPPAPWVPFTRAGCDVADIATANQELENTTPDIAHFFGAGSPEAQQLAADKDSFKDAETADYIGVAVHCAQGNAFCADAKGVKFGQTAATATAAPDVLPDEPGGYNGFQALFGHQPPRLPRLRPDQRLADAGLHGRLAGGGPAGGERLHRRHPRQ
jgi:hypothetical protein